MRKKTAGRVLVALVLVGGISLRVLRPQQNVRRPAQADFPAPGSTREARQQDLDYFSNYLNLDRSYSDGARRQAELMLESLKGNQAELTDVGFELAIRRIVALADNGHSNAFSPSSMEPARTLPVRLFWFDDGLYIVRATREHADLLGGKVVELGELAVEEAATRFRDLVGGTEALFRTYFAPAFLVTPSYLFELGISSDPDLCPVRIQKDSGEIVTRELSTVGTGGRPGPRQGLDPTLLPEEKAGWVTVHSTAGVLPLFLQEGGQAFRVRSMPEISSLYVQFRANRDQPGSSIKSFQQKVRKEVQRVKPRHIVLDLRFNGGGDLTTTWKFMHDLPSLIPPQGRVFIATNGATFSAGIYSFAFAKAADPPRVLSVGSHVGDRETFWAEAKTVFRLPNAPLAISYALEKHDLTQGCPDPAVCHLARQRIPNPTLGSLDPDVPVPYTFRDYREGRDPVLERIQEIIRAAVDPSSP